MVAVIIGILALMSGAMLLNAADKAKEGVVKANVATASSSFIFKLNESADVNVEELIPQVVAELNDPDGVEDSSDEIKSPYNSEIFAFTTDAAAEAGQVTVTTDDSHSVIIKGYGEKGSAGSPIMTKTVTPIESSES